MKLTQEEKNQRIADAAGTVNLWHILKRGYYFRPDAHGYTSNKNEAWKVSEEEAKKWESKPTGYPDDWVTIVKAEPPDYFNDLNVCQSAVFTLNPIRIAIFQQHLSQIASSNGNCFCELLASAWVQAFGLTLNLWTVDES